jgi:hypothetical protein
VVGVGVGIAMIAGGTKGAGYAIGGAGVAALAIGTTMYLVGAGQRSDAQAKLGSTAFLVPTVTVGSAGLSLVGTF